MSENNHTFIGNLTSEPELRYTRDGVPVMNFDIAVNRRTFNRQTNQWEDTNVTFIRINLWRQFAENANATLHKGMEVIVSGEFYVQKWTTKEGEDRLTPTLEVKMRNGAIGPSLKWLQGEMTKSNARGDNSPNAGSSYGSGPSGNYGGQDPWNSTPTTSGASQGGFGGGMDNPPF